MPEALKPSWHKPMQRGSAATRCRMLEGGAKNEGGKKERMMGEARYIERKREKRKASERKRQKKRNKRKREEEI